MTQRTRWCAGLALLVGFGCGGQAPTTGSPQASARAVERDGEALRVNQDAPGKAPVAANAVKAEDLPAERRIIQTATIDLVVKDIEVVRPEVEKIVAEFKGYIAKSDVTGQSGRLRSATWTLKIPVGDYRAAVGRIVALGQAMRNSSDSQDVTEEFVDLQGRVKNLKVEEEALNRLVKEAAVRLEDIFKIREQIKIVRGEIERAEGRVKYLGTMASLSTITLQAKEEVPYAPESPVAAASFGEQIDSRFAYSWGSLVAAGKSLTLFLVSVAPWLPFWLVGGYLAYRVLRRAGRALASNAFTPVGELLTPKAQVVKAEG